MKPLFENDDYKIVLTNDGIFEIIVKKQFYTLHGAMDFINQLKK